MQHPQEHDLLLTELVHDEVGQAGDGQLAGALPAPGAADLRELVKPRHCDKDALANDLSGLRVVLGNVFKRHVKVG